MTETPQQYSQRLLKNVGDRNFLEILESTITRLESICQNFDAKTFERETQPGKWTARQILAHLAEGEIVFSYRIRKALNSNGERIEAYDPDVWVNNAAYLQDDPALALLLFQALRKTNVARLRALTAEQWEKFGVHTERGNESIRLMAHLCAGHDINHLSQLENFAHTNRPMQRED